jgi:hypothetical protein
MAANKIPINRAPVLTLWAVVVAERSGYDPETALTLGKSLAGLNAQSKGQRLGIYGPKPEDTKHNESSSQAKAPAPEKPRLLGREIPVVETPRGLRASAAGQAITPESVQSYLEKKFGDSLPEARRAMELLAKSFTASQLESRAFSLYEKFRPVIPEGRKGWGAKGELDLDLIRSLVKH